MKNNRLANGYIESSSFLLKKVLQVPAVHGIVSIDMISVTIPIPLEETKQLYRLLKHRTSVFQFKKIDLDEQAAGSKKFKKQIVVEFNDGSSFSIFLFGLNDFQNQAKIYFNPNTVSVNNAATVLCLIQDLYGHSNYRLWMFQGNVTGIHYTWDFPNIPFEHVVTDYAYKPQYEPFYDDGGARTGYRYGNKKGCPIICYDKALERNGSHLGYKDFTRFEKQHKPRVRGAKSKFCVAEMEKQKYSFQGITFYDPMILFKMPGRVLSLINGYGIGKALSLLKGEDAAILAKRMKKYRLVKDSDLKQRLEKAFQAKLLHLKQLLVEPQTYLDDVKR